MFRSGLLKEAFTDADIFGINFPMDLDVRMKAVCLATCFLIGKKLLFSILATRNAKLPFCLGAKVQ